MDPHIVWIRITKAGQAGRKATGRGNGRRLVGLDAVFAWRFRGIPYPGSRPETPRRRRQALDRLLSQAVRDSAWMPSKAVNAN